MSRTQHSTYRPCRVSIKVKWYVGLDTFYGASDAVPVYACSERIGVPLKRQRIRLYTHEYTSTQDREVKDFLD